MLYNYLYNVTIFFIGLFFLLSYSVIYMFVYFEIKLFLFFPNHVLLRFHQILRSSYSIQKLMLLVS